MRLTARGRRFAFETRSLTRQAGTLADYASWATVARSSRLFCDMHDQCEVEHGIPASCTVYTDTDRSRQTIKQIKASADHCVRYWMLLHAVHQA